MVESHTSKSKPYSECEAPFVGVALKFYGEDHFHTGILFRSKKSEAVKLVHLENHYDLRCEDPENDYLWVEWNATEEDKKVFCVWVESLLKANPEGIPFGIKYAESRHFNESGFFIKGNPGHGLTCATFVLATFNDCTFPLILLDGWPERREDDKEWQEICVVCAESLLISRDAARDKIEHFKAQKPYIGNTKRYRPEEVAAASAIYSGTPAKFNQIAEVSEYLKDRLIEENS